MNNLLEIQQMFVTMSSAEMHARRDLKARLARLLWFFLRPLAGLYYNNQRRTYNLPPLPRAAQKPRDPLFVLVHWIVFMVLSAWIIAGPAILSLPFPFDQIAARAIMVIALAIYLHLAGNGRNLLYARRIDPRRDWQERLCLHRVSLRRVIGAALLGMVLYPAFAGLEQVLIHVLQAPERIIYPPPADALGVIIWLLLTVAVSALTEEALFRGAVMDVYLRQWSPRQAIIVNGVLFATFHVNFAGFVPLALAGMIIAALRCRDDSIYSAIAFHAGHNLVSQLLLLWC